jgi:hypothetical protein
VSASEASCGITAVAELIWDVWGGSIRILVTSRLWLVSQALGTLFHTIAAFGPVFLWLISGESTVRKQVC